MVTILSIPILMPLLILILIPLLILIVYLI
jgi:hypothetical protein